MTEEFALEVFDIILQLILLDIFIDGNIDHMLQHLSIEESF